MRKGWLLLCALGALVACEHSPTATPPRTPQLSQVARANGHLVGTMLYYTYGVKHAQVLQNVTVPAEVDLTFGSGHAINVVLTEIHGATVLDGQMTPSGELTMVYTGPPGDWLKGYVAEHSGCTVDGQFPVWHGSFDGNRLVAATTFNGHCPVAWPNNEMFPTPVDGPVHWSWSIDLAVAPQ